MTHTLDTYKHEQTGKVHIVNVAFPDTVWICYCSLDRRYDPTEREINLEDEEVCETCAEGFRESELDGAEGEAESEAEVEEDSHVVAD